MRSRALSKRCSARDDLSLLFYSFILKVSVMGWFMWFRSCIEDGICSCEQCKMDSILVLCINDFACWECISRGCGNVFPLGQDEPLQDKKTRHLLWHRRRWTEKNNTCFSWEEKEGLFPWPHAMIGWHLERRRRRVVPRSLKNELLLCVEIPSFVLQFLDYFFHHSFSRSVCLLPSAGKGLREM